MSSLFNFIRFNFSPYATKICNPYDGSSSWLLYLQAKEMLRKKYNKEKREPCDDVAAITKGLTICSLLKEKPSSTLSSVTSSVDLASNVASSPGDERSNYNQAMVASYSTSNMGLRTFLISLGVLVFWGRACAIFCTSIWLLFYPRYHGRPLCLS